MTMMVQQIRRLLRFLPLSIALLSIACQSSSTISEPTGAADCRIVEHEAGSTEICGQPQKVAVLSPHILDIVLALGVQPAGLAQSVESGVQVQTFDNPTEQLPYLGQWVTANPVSLGDRDFPSLERLTLLKPDVIIGEYWQTDKYKLMSQIAPTLLFSDFKDPDKPQSWQQNIEDIAKALGQETQVKELLANQKAQIDQARDTLQPVLQTYPRVLLLHSNLDTHVGLSLNNTTGRLLKEIGFEIIQPTSLGPEPEVSISWEILPQIETDIIIVFDWGEDGFTAPDAPRREKWAQKPLLNSMPVFQQDRVFFVDYYLWGSHTRGPLTDQLILKALPDLLLPSVDQER